MTGFYMKRNTGMKWIKKKFFTNFPIYFNAFQYSAAFSKW